MVLLWPNFLALLVLIPGLGAALYWSQQRKRRAGLRYSSLSLIRPALQERPRLRHWLPPALFLAALATLILAFTRPALVTNLSANQATLVLVIDVSPSMGHTDIQPPRLSAAEAAALSFIQQQEPSTQIGIVSFSGDAQLILPPTTDRPALKSAIKSLTLGQQTAIGSAILTGLEAIAQTCAQDSTPGKSVKNRRGEAISSQNMIVLLTDGVNNCCEPPLKAARIAAERGVRIYTIGFGAKQDPLHSGDLDKSQPVMGPVNDWNNRSTLGFDEQTLNQIATKTGGKYYTAANADELQAVLANLPTRPIIKQETREISVIFTALGALLGVSAMLLSLHWFPLTIPGG